MRSAVRHLGPHWYAPVMGTSIVATAGAGLPLDLPGLRTVCTAFWALALVLLIALLGARATHWARHGDRARAQLTDPATAPFYGCLAMALLSVGGGALVVGRDWIGTPAAVALDAVLFTAGTLTGLAAAVAVPYLLIVRHRPAPATDAPAGIPTGTSGDAPAGLGHVVPAHLLPVVAPMVSAALGPLLLPHLPPGAPRETLLLGCLALFGLSLLATLVLLPTIFAGLLTGGTLPLALTPTLFLVLGPLGQSMTAVGHFAAAAPQVVPAPYDAGAAVYDALVVLYGVPVTGFALFWLALAAAMVVRARRRGMAFTMTWWSFTFPVGTCVTGTEGLARHTGLAFYDALAVALCALLVAAWTVAAAGTVRGLSGGQLLAEPRPARVVPAPTTVRTT